MAKPAKALRIGFTGTQVGMRVRQLRSVGQAILCHCLIEYLPVEFHHGDCIGADEQAHMLARALWFKVFVHPPEDRSKRAYCTVSQPDRIAIPKPYLLRNKDIVDQTEVLIAAPKGEEEQRSGTWATIRYARKLNRPTYICYPDGRLVFENVPTQSEIWARKKQSPPVRPALVASLEEEPILYCSVCGMLQHDTSSGLVCKNGHGGADSVDAVFASGIRARVREQGKLKRWSPDMTEDTG